VPVSALENQEPNNYYRPKCQYDENACKVNVEIFITIGGKVIHWQDEN
jgi:hypothetical protein